MKDETRAPLTASELIELDDRQIVEEDGRPWGHINDHAFAFFSTDRITLESIGKDGVSVLRSAAPLFHGIPVVDEKHSAAKTVSRTLEERRKARERRFRDGVKIRPRRRGALIDGYCPRGVPAAYLPTVVSGFGAARFGVSARGTSVLLSTVVVQTKDGQNHSTIIDGESRQFLRPTRYPYTAVCKLELWTQNAATGAWANSGMHASGFLVGRRLLITSGHAFANASGTFAIRVIPACWANSPVFGLGLITWVLRRRRWHSDSGNDLQICQLADPVGDSVGFFGASTYDSDWEDLGIWAMAGFPYDRSIFGMSVQLGISVRDDDDGDDIDLDGNTYDTTQVESDADEASGASGSPLFAWFGAANACAVGVHSGTATDATVSGNEIWSCAAGGEGFVEVVRWGRSNWD